MFGGFASCAFHAWLCDGVLLLSSSCLRGMRRHVCAITTAMDHASTRPCYSKVLPKGAASSAWPAAAPSAPPPPALLALPPMQQMPPPPATQAPQAPWQAMFAPQAQEFAQAMQFLQQLMPLHQGRADPLITLLPKQPATPQMARSPQGSFASPTGALPAHVPAQVPGAEQGAEAEADAEHEEMEGDEIEALEAAAAAGKATAKARCPMSVCWLRFPKRYSAMQNIMYPVCWSVSETRRLGDVGPSIY